MQTLFGRVSPPFSFPIKVIKPSARFLDIVKHLYTPTYLVKLMNLSDESNRQTALIDRKVGPAFCYYSAPQNLFLNSHKPELSLMLFSKHYHLFPAGGLQVDHGNPLIRGGGW